ncbi:MAG TPA: sigma-70 family RNA polymerase sigma factor [Agriterribacter sp.]|nr:sigma-70 family RNA polymerase sigma factor [Agriterribacter sp.]
MCQEVLYTDSYLLTLIANGEEWAFETVYRRYWRSLLNTAFKRLNDRQQSEDAVQNVFMRLWNKRESLKVNNLPAYLNMAVRYEVLKWLSRNKSNQYFHSVLEEVMVDVNTADQRIVSAELADLVASFVQTLPEKRRNILILHLQDNWSTKEIAHILGISQKTVQNQLRTALNGMQTRIIQ